MKNFKENLKTVKAFAFDVDGVFAEPVIVLHPNGEMMRTMNTKDGFAVFHAIKQGFPVAIISGGKSDSLYKRFRDLGITDIYLGTTDKYNDFKDYISKYDVKPEEVLYMGDDLPDFEVMQYVGLPVCPSDAAPEIKAISQYISDKSGGKGCVRDVIEQVMRSQNKWNIKS
jgi:3-deoxy-D-manno-octulosonate 8-phosphate phosphatase (KDO 8-P phosphatase)